MGRLGEFGKTGELGEPGTESGAERQTRFLRGDGERLCEICVCGGGFLRGGFLGGGSCRKGNLRERHEREGEMSHARGGFWGKGMTGKASCVMPEREFVGKA